MSIDEFVIEKEDFRYFLNKIWFKLVLFLI